VIANRSMPVAIVIPVLGYADVTEASRWLCDAFAFRPRLRIGDHRVQLVYGEGAIVVTGGGPADGSSHSLLVRVEDVDRHADRAATAGARIVSPPTDYEYGERQYTAEDIGGHRWTFSESISDADPADWGGDLVDGG
jgi:uncharacterized glyoxalase superfamily protein PhnB